MILGAIIGDVVGSIYEFNNIKVKDFSLLSSTSRFTDDTVMTLAVAQALKTTFEDKIPITDALVTSMRSLGRCYPTCGYGSSFNAWIFDSEEKPAPYHSWGNGSAMRVSPAGWISDTLEAVEIIAAETAKVTHNHPEGIRGAQAVAACVLLSRQGFNNHEIRTLVNTRYDYSLDFTLDEIRHTYEFDASCQGSVPQAIEAFLESDGFEDALRNAVSIGGDSDTIAAITASIAQGRYEIPHEIEEAVRNKLPSDLLEINDQFCHTYCINKQ